MARLSEIELRILEKQTIDCEDITAILGDFVDNELSPSLRDRVHSHIRTCPECQEGEMRYREVIALAKELPEDPMPSEVSRRLKEALNRKLGLNISF